MRNINHHSNGRRVLTILSDAVLFIAGTAVALVFVCAFWPFFTTPTTNLDSPKISEPKSSFSVVSNGGGDYNCQTSSQGFNLRYDPPDPTFYDDPEIGYTVNAPIKNWDGKRRQWLKHHPSFQPGLDERIVLLTGSQSTPCKNPIGDHLLLRFFKNKVDYCRIHGYDIFYNNVQFHPEMHTYWAKIPTVKAAMLAHPEAEWIWWVDSDAAFTDMDFKLPLNRYRDHNFVVHGWPELIYKKRSSTSLNAGVFLIRNCQWSLDFMEVWSSMGPQTPEYDNWGKIQRETCKDKFFPQSDDQTGLIYLLLKEHERWGKKIYVEDGYYFEGYWLEIVETLGNITEKYKGVEKGERRLRRRHAEKVSERYAALWEEFLRDTYSGVGGWRRPFMVHFTGCQPCSGQLNQLYSEQKCWDSMQKVLNFADNQVLRNFGFVHRDLQDPSSVLPLPFDYPA